MSKNISKNSRLLVVSDTGMFIESSSEIIKAFGPVVNELEELLKLFEMIVWIGFNNENQNNNKSYVALKSSRIEVVLLDKVGGKSIFDKINILYNYPKMWRIINFEIKKTTFIHVRAPSNPAVIAMLLSYKFMRKTFWFKYAGNWKGRASMFYKFQRFLLKQLRENSKITINGTWKTKNENILGFENPCLIQDDRVDGNHTIQNKKLTKLYNFCFVGGLNDNKGVQLIMDAFCEIAHPNLCTLHIVGDGVLRAALEIKAKSIATPVIFHGFLNKVAIVEIYKTCHFILLPSKSEGFPKVIGEAMNFGCIPIVSDISCIGQYIQNNNNGFLLNPINKEALIYAIYQCFEITPETFRAYILTNYKMAAKFTYSYYLKRIQKEILTERSITS